MKVPSRPILITGTAAVLALTTSLTATATASAAAPAHHKHHHKIQYTTNGRAYGSKVQVGTLAGSGKSARTATGCGVTNALKQSKTAHVNLSTLGGAHAVRSGSHTITTATGASRTATKARTAAVSLLNGLIKLRAIRAKAIAHGGAHPRLHGGSRFIGLSIAGHRIIGQPKPNSSFKIPGIAKLMFNQQRKTTHGHVQRMIVNALKVKLLGGNLKGGLGTTVRLGHAMAAVRPLHTSTLRGTSYGTQVSVGNLVTSNPTFESKLLCNGGNGKATRHRGASVNLPGLLVTGAVRTMARGKHGAAPSTATRTTVAHVNLLNGAITATAIRSQANAIRHGRSVSKSDGGTRFLGLKILGHKIKDSIKPNTSINLLGIGTLWLNKVTTKHSGVEVHGLELVLGKALDGLQKGAVIDISNARSIVKRH